MLCLIKVDTQCFISVMICRRFRSNTSIYKLQLEPTPNGKICVFFFFANDFEGEFIYIYIAYQLHMHACLCYVFCDGTSMYWLLKSSITHFVNLCVKLKIRADHHFSSLFHSFLSTAYNTGHPFWQITNWFCMPTNC